MEKVFNKLVRDNIPDIIASNGEEAVIKVLDDDEYKKELYKKLLEETNEVISSKDFNETIEELADVLEILSAIAKLNNKKLDDVVEVADGYANFLIGQGKAIAATADNLKKLKEDKEKEAEEAAHQLQVLNKLKDEINNKPINIYIKMGDDGKLFGSVTTKQIAEEFEKAYGIKIDKRKIEIQTDINSLGIYEAEVKLHKDIEAKIEVHVVEKKD